MADTVSWLLIEAGWTVLAADGTEVGKVDEVTGDSNADIFAANRATGHIALSVAASGGRTRRVRVHEDGSLRVPTRHRSVEESSPLGRLLEQIHSVRADLRFREDGIHTTLTIDRKPRAK